MLIVSDVHGAFDALRRVVETGETVLILGDLVNLTDYRNGEGINADLLGVEFARAAGEARARGDFGAMRRIFRDTVGDRVEEFRQAFAQKLADQYVEMRFALTDARAYVTYGNVDRPSVLQSHLPDGCRFVDGEVIEIEGVSVGFVGGGTSTPLNAEGEVTDEAMAEKLERMGPVDVLCSHVPPAIDPLRTDVVTGRRERASQPILDYLLRHQPRFHFYGDVHQPQAARWRVGTTTCLNAGYFRATGRPVVFRPGEGDSPGALT